MSRNKKNNKRWIKYKLSWTLVTFFFGNWTFSPCLCLFIVCLFVCLCYTQRNVFSMKICISQNKIKQKFTISFCKFINSENLPRQVEYCPWIWSILCVFISMFCFIFLSPSFHVCGSYFNITYSRKNGWWCA